MSLHARRGARDTPRQDLSKASVSAVPCRFASAEPNRHLELVLWWHARPARTSETTLRKRTPRQELVTSPVEKPTPLAELSELLPVFIHSSFRTSSTWIWSKIRQLAITTAYYEVFHEDLQSFTPAAIGALVGNSWPSRHPAVAPYFWNTCLF